MKKQYMSYQESLDFLYKMEKTHPDLIESLSRLVQRMKAEILSLPKYLKM